MRAIAILLVAVTCAFASAQGAVTSPRGFDNVEGNAAFAHWGGSRRFQQIDQTQIASPVVIRSIAWRRNGNNTGTPSRTFDFQVDLGRCNFGVISELLDANYVAGTRTTVFSQGAVSFPDWSASLPGPTPFDFQIMLPTLYVYVPIDALVIDFSYTNNSSSASLATDREFNGLTSLPLGASLGTGCIATGRATQFSHTASLSNHEGLPTPAYGMRLRLGGLNAPAAPVAVTLIDSVNQNLGGVLCSTLYAGPAVTVLLRCLPNGTVPEVSLGFDHDVSLIGATLYTQLAAPDPGRAPIPIALSNGRQTTMTGTAQVGSHRCSYAWYTLPSTTGVATHFIGGGMVMLLQ